VIQINAVDNSQARGYNLQVTHSTVDEGDLTYSTVTVNIGYCVITHIDIPTAPTSLAYTVFDPTPLVSTLTPEFLQVPACGYAIQHNIVWTIPVVDPATLFVVDAADLYTFTTESTSGLTHHNTYTLHVQDFVTYQDLSWEPYYEFTVVITDPCRTSVFPTYTVDSMSVVLGETGT
jgi:hypothetical protein